MRKVLRLALIFIVLVFVLIQFFQPDKNKGEISKNHLYQQEQLPAPIENIFTNACLDCHSNNTRYLWYHNIAPVSWIVNKHILEGKKELNLSDWGDLDMFKKIKNLEKMCQEAEHKTMPIKGYTALHPEAKLSDEQIAALCKWSTKLSEEMLANAIKK